MKSLLRISALLIAVDHWAIVRGAVLSLVVLLTGAALLGLSGWFITATGLAGLAGIGIAFDVFRPAAGVRFLALGRAAARYGERLLTHDATLRALAALRVVLLRGYARENARALMQLRSEAALTRILADVDALDGVLLRLILPIVAAMVTYFLVFLGLGWIVGWPVAIVIFLVYLPVSVAILVWYGWGSVKPSVVIEETGQRLRRGVIDMLRDRAALILSARLSDREQLLRQIDEHARLQARHLDRADRNAGASLSMLTAVVTMGALVVAAWLLEMGAIDPARAAIGVFVSLVLVEALLPLRRGISDFGRMVVAAERVIDRVSVGSSRAVETRAVETGSADAHLLTIEKAHFKLALELGESVALTGPSGVGKTTLLMQIAGLSDSTGILVKGLPPYAWSDQKLRAIVTLLPQRSALIAGSVRDNLSLGITVPDPALWEVLDAVALADDIRLRGGLDAVLGEGGQGLSGGQARRLALARCLLQQPHILLLDEPIEGLDAKTADVVLQGVRKALPKAAIVTALHRGQNHRMFDRHIHLYAR